MTNMPFSPPPGMIGDDTVFAAPGRWRNGSWVRFWEGNWQVKGGYERLLLTNLGGVCRAVLGWQDGAGVQSVAFGLHNALRFWQSGLFQNITPALNFPPQTLGANPISTVNLSPTVTMAQPAHGYQVGQSVTISGATTPVNGIATNGVRVIVAVTANTWTWTAPGNATATGAGGGALVVVQNQTAFIPGQIDGTGGAGFGTGAYGVGNFGEPSTADYFPLTWSLAAFGGTLMANPRGRTIFKYTVGDPVALPLANAPRVCTYMVTTASRQVMAFGCNEEVGGVFNQLCIRWSDIENDTVWNATSQNNAGEWILEAGGRIVGAKNCGDYVLVWTTTALFLGSFIGDPGQTWRFERVGQNCGLIGPNASIVRSQNAEWITPDRQFWTYPLGGAPRMVDCPIRSDFEDYFAQGQDDKITGSGVTTFGEVTWFYADRRDGLECSRAFTNSANGWSRDLIARSAFCDAGPQPNPIGVSPSGFAYWHEKGHSADGAILSGFLESTDFYMAEADGGVMANGVWPDFKNQVGTFQMRIFGREYPQSQERTYGPWALQPGQSRRPFRMAARIARVRYDFASAPAYARGGNPMFDVEPIGGR